jgi:hypothetical protein
MKKHQQPLQVILEPESGAEATARLQAAFDMLFAGMVIELPENMRSLSGDLTESEPSLS